MQIISRSVRLLCHTLVFVSFGAFAQTEDPADVIQIQLDAYNDQDVYTFSDMFHEDAVIFNNLGDAHPSLIGREAIRKFYDDFFNAFQHNRSELISRAVQGNFVFDHQKITGRADPLNIMTIYEVVDGYIVRVWFAR